jgi:hypothetical protein
MVLSKGCLTLIRYVTTVVLVQSADGGTDSLQADQEL